MTRIRFQQYIILYQLKFADSIEGNCLYAERRERKNVARPEVARSTQARIIPYHDNAKTRRLLENLICQPCLDGN